MKKIIKAFTLVELLVVISIITILSVGSVFYFLDFVKNQELNQKIMLIEDEFDDLNKKVSNFELFDYELHFNTNNGNRGYIGYLNNFDINKYQFIDFNSITGSGTIKTNGTSSDAWKMKLYRNNKLFKFEYLSGDSSYNFNFNTDKTYKIIGTLSGEVLNEIDINYFSNDNIYPEKNNLLELISINSKEDKTGTSYTDIIIKNIGGNKSIGNNENEIYLFFENNGKEKFIKITK